MYKLYQISDNQYALIKRELNRDIIVKLTFGQLDMMKTEAAVRGYFLLQNYLDSLFFIPEVFGIKFTEEKKKRNLPEWF